MPRRRLVIGLAIAGISTFLAFEILTRLLFPDFTWYNLKAKRPVYAERTMIRPHPLYHHRYKPNLRAVPIPTRAGLNHQMTTNPFGFIDAERTPGPSARIRIIFLGDSFTMAMLCPPEQRFTAHFQRLLDEAFGPDRFEALNFGTATWSPIVYARVYQHLLPGFCPDLVFICLDNSDPTDDEKLAESLVPRPDGALVFDYPVVQDYMATYSRGPKGWLRRHVRAYLLLMTAADAIVEARQPRYRLADLIMREPFGPDGARLWKGSQKYIRQCLGTGRQKNFPTVLVTYPESYNVDKVEHIETGWHAGFADRERRPFDTFYELWLRRTPDLDKNAIHLTEDLRAYKKAHPQNRLYWRHDNHFAPLGHQVFARALFKKALPRLHRLAQRGQRQKKRDAASK